MTKILTLNAGSSTLKIGIFAVEQDRPVRVGEATIDMAEHPFILRLKAGAAPFETPLKHHGGSDLVPLLEGILRELGKHFDMRSVTASGHRVVHGGDIFKGPVLLDDPVVATIETLADLAPLHQRPALRLIQALRQLRPDLRQTASFDTTFHSTIPELVRRFAIPRTFHDQGVKRYGFHGLSYRFIAGALSQKAPDIARSKVVIAHLGSGASLCAIEQGVSRDTSMGFSTLDGIAMATRPGTLDPGVLLHLLGPLGKTIDEVEHMLYHQSGLLGVSGISSDVRKLLADGSAPAGQAIDIFVLRIAGEIARLATTLQGLDAIVFTAGIGENQPEIRRRILDRLQWLGVSLDAHANAQNAFQISTSESRVAVHVMPTDEEQMIAEECVHIIGSTKAS
jgi:acetate kinase